MSIFSRSFFFYSVSGSCAVEDLGGVLGSRYDLERFGVFEADVPEDADILFISGVFSAAGAECVKEIYQKLKTPKYVISLGVEALGQLPVFAGVPIEEIVPVDLFIVGSPPRPESILDAIILAKGKLNER